MARKRLSDLLRDEAQKPAPATERPSKAAAKPAARRPARSTKATPTEEPPAPVEASVVETPPSNPELEAAIAQLQSLLSQAQQREQSLQQQISGLETELHHQQQQVQQLQEHLTKANRLQPELEQAKKAALQLAEANQKLTQELESLRHQNGNGKVHKAEVVEPAPAALTPQPSAPTRRAVTLIHPVFPNGQPARMTEQDLGWFD